MKVKNGDFMKTTKNAIDTVKTTNKNNVSRETIKKVVNKKQNIAKINNTLKYDFTKYIAHVNDKIENTDDLQNGVKNNHTFNFISYTHVNAHAKSSEYKPHDAYLRFDNNTEMWLQFNEKQNIFDGYIIYICCNDHEKLFNNIIFDKCNDGARISKSKKLNFETFNETMNILVTLPKFDRNKQK